MKALLQQALDYIAMIDRNTTTDPRYMAHLAITAIEQALSRVDEPVAWMFTAPGISKVDVWKHGGNWKPLFLHPAAPQHRAPLEDDEIDKILASSAGYGRTNFYAFARAIEAAHGIKGEL